MDEFLLHFKKPFQQLTILKTAAEKNSMSNTWNLYKQQIMFIAH